MFLLVTVCNISWWMIALSTIVPAILGWYLAKLFGNDRNEELQKKIEQLQSELKKCYEKKQVVKTNLVAPKVKFSDAAISAKGEKSNKSSSSKLSGASSKQEPLKKAKPPQKMKKASNVGSITAKAMKYPKLNDNLEIIEGVGPKMREILESNGIKTWSQLATKSPKELRTVLDKYGDRYRIIDPKEWPGQAKLANSNEWSKLITQQESLGGKDGKKSNSKVSKFLVKYGYNKKYKQDDLKAIEGIGPKIAGLLQADGINTWNQLAQTNTDQLNAILEKAGKRYALASPKSWPSQAKLAAEGNFSGLQQLQAKLKGGK